jgi:hypothetical protein
LVRSEPLAISLPQSIPPFFHTQLPPLPQRWRQHVSPVETQWTTRRYIPEDGTLRNHCCENLKFYTIRLEFIYLFHIGEWRC